MNKTQVYRRTRDHKYGGMHCATAKIGDHPGKTKFDPNAKKSNLCAKNCSELCLSSNYLTNL